jgi:hypothetical protein
MAGKGFQLCTPPYTTAAWFNSLNVWFVYSSLYSLTCGLYSCAWFLRKGMLTRESRYCDLRKRFCTNAIEQRPITVHAYPCQQRRSR